MSDADEIELSITDNVYKILDKKKCKTKDEVVDIIGQLKYKFIDDVECAFDNILDNYCEKHNLEWEE
jgi:hypothetical protein